MRPSFAALHNLSAGHGPDSRRARYWSLLHDFPVETGAVTVAVLALAFGLAVGLVTPQPVAHAGEKPAVKAEKKTNRTPKPFAWNFARQKLRE